MDSLQRISDECDSLNSYLDEHLSLVDGLKFLKRDFKFLDIILNSQIIIDEPDVREILPCFKLLQLMSQRSSQSKFKDQGITVTVSSDVQHKFRETKLKIRAKYSIPKISYKDGIVVPNIVMEFIDTVTENLCGLPKLNDPSSFLCVRGLMWVKLKGFKKELKKWPGHMITVTWLYFPSNRYGYLTCPNEEYHLFSWYWGTKIQPIEPNICKMYIDVLKALKATIASNCETIKATLQEMLNILRTNLINLPTKALEFHLRDIDSVIIDAGLLVYSLIGNKHEKEVTALEKQTSTNSGSMKETIYFITRKSSSFGPTYLGLMDWDPLKEIKCFHKVVEQHDGIQHFATRVMSLAYEVESILMLVEGKFQTEAAREHTPHFASNPSKNEEMVGFKDVMVELIGKLIGGSSDLDVISIVGNNHLLNQPRISRKSS
ncbi:hypothetical protein HAX54_004550 [Datura stramonium]|uniref:Late blight resistance protein R1A-like N-terminal domain-containing protein n=1 Tax=Datura stramonium TaxID=4076 RepID=A0ABS8WT05_DATST|nr:hypothetical protein [Datura stramonium]